MRLTEIARQVKLDEKLKKKRKTPYVADSPVADRLASVGGGPVMELASRKECLVETDDQNMAGRFDTVVSFTNFAMNELKMQKPIKVNLVKDREAHGLKTFAHYDPNTNECVAYTGDRSLADILRSIAHEMTHAAQFEKGKIQGPVQDIGGPIEDEANAMAGRLVKKFGYKNPDIFE